MTWIGGSPCSGKSTAAGAMAAERGAALYSCDDAFARHASAGGPTLRKVAGMSVGDRLRQPVQVQVDDTFRLYREEFPLILDDLSRISGEVVVEGAALLPELLAELRVPAGDAVWMVPTGEFQRRHYAQREWAWALLDGEAQPERLFDRWMRRDALFASAVAEQARELGYRVLVTSGS